MTDDVSTIDVEVRTHYDPETGASSLIAIYKDANETFTLEMKEPDDYKENQDAYDKMMRDGILHQVELANEEKSGE